ncbi:hypothetical protein IF2G_04779 [Cordyceps javanica]|nr:hypothetical protein IF2G_04779 [Cordyceps javanica]
MVLSVHDKAIITTACSSPPTPGLQRPLLRQVGTYTTVSTRRDYLESAWHLTSDIPKTDALIKPVTFNNHPLPSPNSHHFTPSKSNHFLHHLDQPPILRRGFHPIIPILTDLFYYTFAIPLLYYSSPPVSHAGVAQVPLVPSRLITY